MVIPSSYKYILQALVALAKFEPDERKTVSEIAQQTITSKEFLNKLFQPLIKVGIIDTLKGKKGGVRLTPNGRKASLMQVIESLSDHDFSNTCLIQLGACEKQKNCPVHLEWDKARSSLIDTLGKIQIQDLASNSSGLGMDFETITPLPLQHIT